jgi:hypothetical protein
VDLGAVDGRRRRSDGDAIADRSVEGTDALEAPARTVSNKYTNGPLDRKLTW